ncbi:unnamed protein product (mitochondrion) [Plasmodiophora brassicae]|uniref:ADP,ATP carrier protein n=1 Tax=Plasmodiophora brassicae TaxID=37360 RepID=A0A0G4IMD2_PLABS|nr:hypothetical protein PBRA_005004 [Plasmodiophora brassicae]SPQ99271.1 unnamed protein product [Plasmodiophora brassicae]
MSAYWPVEPHENKKVVPMVVMMFLIAFCYTLLRDLKDVLVLDTMTTSAMPFLKLGLTLPASVIIMLTYTKMTTKMSSSSIFYSFMAFFISFFLLYGAVLYPLQEWIEPGDEWISQFVKPTKEDYDNAHKSGKPVLGRDDCTFPQGLAPVMMILGRWSTALLYVMSELWGSVVLSLLFWGYANEICRTDEAKRFYFLFNIGANFSLMFSGAILITIGAITGDKKSTKSSGDAMYPLLGLVVVFGCVIVAIYRWMQNNVLTDPRLYAPLGAEAGAKKRGKVKLGFTEGLKVVFTSSYVAYIGIIVMMYGMCVNFVEIYYKDAWRHYFPSVGQKLMFSGAFSMGTGVVALLLLIFVGGKAIRTIGWTRTALISPISIVTVGVPFMALFMFQKRFSFMASAVLVALGYIAVVIAKSFKYSFFDPTKEMAFIPLGEDRGRAKAAVDVVGARLGKSGGGLIQIVLLNCFGTKDVSGIVEVLVVLTMVMVAIWIVGTVSLGKQYRAKVGEHEERPITVVVAKATPAPETC